MISWLKQLWHTAWHMGHTAKLGYYNYKVCYRGCSCGRVFRDDGRG